MDLRFGPKGEGTESLTNCRCRSGLSPGLHCREYNGHPHSGTPNSPLFLHPVSTPHPKSPVPYLPVETYFILLSRLSPSTRSLVVCSPTRASSVTLPSFFRRHPRRRPEPPLVHVPRDRGGTWTRPLVSRRGRVRSKKVPCQESYKAPLILGLGLGDSIRGVVTTPGVTQ